MIRALILSDIHGESNNLRWLLEEVWKQVGPIDAYICLGDGVRDFDNAEAFIRRRDEHATMYAVLREDAGHHIRPESGVKPASGYAPPLQAMTTLIGPSARSRKELNA